MNSAQGVERDGELEFFQSIGLPVKRKHIRFLKRWTWFDSNKAREFSAQGRAEAAGEWAKSAARDVFYADELKDLAVFMTSSPEQEGTK